MSLLQLVHLLCIFFRVHDVVMICWCLLFAEISQYLGDEVACWTGARTRKRRCLSRELKQFFFLEGLVWWRRFGEGWRGISPQGPKSPEILVSPFDMQGLSRPTPSDPHESLPIHVVQKISRATRGTEEHWTLAMLLLL